MIKRQKLFELEFEEFKEIPIKIVRVSIEFDTILGIGQIKFTFNHELR